MALTDAGIRQSKPREKPFKLPDGGGLFLYVTVKGARLWRWKYRYEGKEKLMSFGAYPDVSLAQARDLHRQARELLASGVDPMAARKVEKQADAPCRGSLLMNSPQSLAVPEGYADWLAQLKHDIQQARQRAALAVNAELVLLYHRIGIEIQQRQQTQGWGAKVIDRLARDLKEAFPDIRGFSSRNLKYMSFFAQHCPDRQFGQQAAAQLPWFHIVTLLTILRWRRRP
jgi:hypothetical protein